MTRYWPDASVSAERVFSINAALEASTETPGRTAPDASRTVPVNAPWAKTVAGSRRTARTTRNLTGARIRVFSFRSRWLLRTGRTGLRICLWNRAPRGNCRAGYGGVTAVSRLSRSCKVVDERTRSKNLGRAADTYTYRGGRVVRISELWRNRTVSPGLTPLGRSRALHPWLFRIAHNCGERAAQPARVVQLINWRRRRSWGGRYKGRGMRRSG